MNKSVNFNAVVIVAFFLCGQNGFAWDRPDRLEIEKSLAKIEAEKSPENKNRLLDVLDQRTTASDNDSKCKIMDSPDSLVVQGPTDDSSQMQIEIPLLATEGSVQTLVSIDEPISFLSFAGISQSTTFTVTRRTERPVTDAEIVATGKTLRPGQSRPNHLIVAVIRLEVPENSTDVIVKSATFKKTLVGKYGRSELENVNLNCD